jgi:hypothetical protein
MVNGAGIWSKRVSVDVDSFDGFTLQGLTEPIGKVQATHLTGDRPHLILKTGRIGGKTECVPFGLVDSVDIGTRTLHIPYTRDIVSNAPEPPKGQVPDSAYLDGLERYWLTYAPG